MFMVMEITDDFSFDAKPAPTAQIQSSRMGRTHVEIPEALPAAKPGEKWLLMERIFKLDRSRGYTKFKRRTESNQPTRMSRT